MAVTTRSRSTLGSIQRRRIVISDTESDSDTTSNHVYDSDSDSDNEYDSKSPLTVTASSSYTTSALRDLNAPFAGTPVNGTSTDVPSKTTFNEIMEKQIQTAVDMITSRLSYEMRNGRYFGTLGYMELFQNSDWTFDNMIVREAFHRVEEIMSSRHLIYTFKIDSKTGFKWRIDFDTTGKRRAMIRRVLRGVAAVVTVMGTFMATSYFMANRTPTDE